MQEARLYVLGSGTALPSATRDNTSLAVSAVGGLWLIDCGSNIYGKLLGLGLSPLRLRGIFLSHNHLDHIYGLPALLFHLKLAGWRDDGPRLAIYGNAPTLDMARRVLDDYQIDQYQPPTAWVTLTEDEAYRFAEDEALAWFSTPVVHSRPTLAVQVVVKETGYTAVYSADTGPCKSLVRLATGADMLFHECTAVEPFEGHSTPQQVGKAAALASVDRLVVLHYDPCYLLSTEETLARIRKGGFGGEVIFAEDGMVLPLCAASE